MASEELQGSNLPNQAQPPAPAPSTLPQYPEMILAAIEALNEKNGSNKSSISKHIEATYGNLPPAHSTLLTHHLNKMKSTGQLQFLKNNYFKPDPNAPPRRGRGRPPKPKTPLPPGAVPLPPRPRGRPPNPATQRLLLRRLNPRPQVQLVLFLGKNVAVRRRLPRQVWLRLGLRLRLPPLEVRLAGVEGHLK
ncbi:hypothetical protein Pfo_023625 [Paulownia fortunei]|nr:hypothetical protein Pfo_023625 [Paulownia fortunei]